MSENRSIEAILAECEAQIERHEMSGPYSTLQELIRYGSKADLERLKGPLSEILARFYPKRRRDLTSALNDRLEGRTIAKAPLSPALLDDFRTAERRFQTNVAHLLSELSSVHIFQWSTYYRDAIQKIIEQSLAFIESTQGRYEPFDWLGKQFQDHSREIFSKGYRYVSSLAWATRDQIASKSLAGVRSFLAIPVENYADQSARLSDPRDCRLLRRLTSKMLSGILLGYGSVALGESDAKVLLRSTIKSWAHLLPLLTSEDLASVESILRLRDVAPVLGEPLAMLITSIDEASENSSVDPVVILSATASLDEGAFDIALRPPDDSSDTRPLEVALLEGDPQLVAGLISNRAKRGYIACLTTISPAALWPKQAPPPEVKQVLVPLRPGKQEDVKGSLLDRLRLRFYEKAIAAGPATVLRTNIAERFPLENPTILAYFRVKRPSIRALDRMLSTRTGVMLWCSVRRSGKTTGVTELASTAEERQIVLQRCESSGTDKTARLLFDSVRQALAEKNALAPDFLRRLVVQASPMGSDSVRQSVLIIDEYDRLFGTLKAAGRGNEDIRHLIIQPLLDQVVEFAHDNLVVLLGQQPNAHYIFMDQNQLSAYVQQQPYPLFDHTPGSSRGEFWDLLSKVFQQTLYFEPSFATAVFAETAGHPFLTVNLLRDFVDWLIGKKIVPAEMTLTAEIFADYASIHLKRKGVASSRHYEFFRAATGEALSNDGKLDSPWLHAVYTILRLLAVKGGAKLQLARGELDSIVNEVINEAGLTSYSAESFITSAVDSNFLFVDGDCVQPRISLLARLAAIRG